MPKLDDDVFQRPCRMADRGAGQGMAGSNMLLWMRRYMPERSSEAWTSAKPESGNRKPREALTEPGAAVLLDVLISWMMEPYKDQIYAEVLRMLLTKLRDCQETNRLVALSFLSAANQKSAPKSVPKSTSV